MRGPILVKLVTEEKPKSLRQTAAGVAKIAIGLIKDVGAISALLLAILSFFPDGKALIVNLFSLGQVEEPETTQVEPSEDTIDPGSAPSSGSVLSPLGWSYLGNEEKTDEWYFPALAELEPKNWAGKTVKPKTSIYLRSEPISAINPDPVALAVIGNSQTISECLRVVDSRTSNRGSIWLRGHMVECE